MPLNKTVSISTAALRRNLDLPDYVDEATITAALRCAPPFSEIRASAAVRRPAVRAAAPAPRPAPVLDVAARARVSTDVELRALAGSVQTTADRAAVAEELSHRQAMATHYPGLHRGDGPRVRHFS